MDGVRWLAVVGIVIMFGFDILLFVTLPIPASTVGEIRLCDKAVSTVLGSTDPVELQRASIIICNLRCGIDRRLDDTGAFKPRAGL
jgi:hypothetical protein